MRILMLAHRIPYPPHTGDKTRAFHIARHLARRHEVTLGCLIDDSTDTGGLVPLREMVGAVEVGRLWKPWSVGKGLVRLGVGGSVSMSYFYSRALQQRVAYRAAQRPYDLVYLSSTPMARYARELDAPVVMDFVDVDSDKWRQYAEHVRAPAKWLYRMESRRLEAAEAEVARSARLCLLATPAEEVLLRSFAPWARTAVVRNGISLDQFQPFERSTAPAAVIFTGAMDYLPNVDAVRYFCHEILPLVRHRVPETRVYIVGLNPSAEVRRLAETPGVTVTGMVPDVRPYYHRASVCVAPLRIGRGVQNKVLQAMAMGLPVVASSVAHRGLEAVPGRHLHVEDKPEVFAERVIGLLVSPRDAVAMGRQGRAFVESHHGWDASLARLEATLQSLVDEGRGLLRRPA